MEEINITTKEQKTIEKVVEKLFSQLEIDGTFTLEVKENILDIIVETKDTGIIIGYHGEILESLQLVLSLVIAKEVGRFVRISVEVDGYKKNRTDYLEKLAIQVKERVISEHKEQTLVSLKPWERRAVHLFLQDDEEVTTESSGEGRDRVLVIRPR